MPGFNGTGPMGMGPMTGGGRGFCAVPPRTAFPAYAGPGFAMPYTPYPGLPYHGMPSYTPETARKAEYDYLKSLVDSIQQDLQEIEKRIQQLEPGKD